MRQPSVLVNQDKDAQLGYLLVMHQRCRSSDKSRAGCKPPRHCSKVQSAFARAHAFRFWSRGSWCHTSTDCFWKVVGDCEIPIGELLGVESILFTWEYTWIIGVRTDAQCGIRSSSFPLLAHMGTEATHMAYSAVERPTWGRGKTNMAYPASEAWGYTWIGEVRDAQCGSS